MAEQCPRRRLAAIFAADIVGYTRLMDQDEAAAPAMADELAYIIDALHKAGMSR